MADNVTVRVEGIAQTVKVVKRLSNSLKGKEMGNPLLRQAQIIAEDARSRAPLGPTGNLKRSLHARMLEDRPNFPKVAIAAVDRKIAPHAHLVEFGTSRAAAHPYFRPAVDAHASKAISNIKDGAKKLVEKAV